MPKRVIHDGWPMRERDLERRIADLERITNQIEAEDGTLEEWQQVAAVLCELNEELRLLQRKH